MPEDSVKRKFTAILCADVKGYSRMMGEDEVGTYQTLTANLSQSVPLFQTQLHYFLISIYLLHNCNTKILILFLNLK